jgi:hypothetical protein
MTTKKENSKNTKKSQVKIGKLTINKETVKDLADKEAEQIKGGAPQRSYVVECDRRTEVCVTVTSVWPAC